MLTFQTGISRKANGADKVAYGALAADGVTHVLKVTGDVTIEGGTWTHEANPTMKSTEDAWIDGKGVWRMIADIGGNLVRFAILDWGPMLLKESKGLTLDKAGWVVALFEIAGIAGMVLAGRATERLAGGRGPRVCLVMMVGAAASMAATSATFRRPGSCYSADNAHTIRRPKAADFGILST